MDWTDEGIVLHVRRHGEASVILQVMTRAHGRHAGIVRGGRSKRLQPILQPGNQLRLTWKARLSEHLGHFSLDPLHQRAGQLMANRAALYTLQTLTAHLQRLPERDPHADLYEALDVLLDHADDPIGAALLLARYEAALLRALGVGLDLSQCAATGDTDDLIYVSPKSGRAVSREAGAPYAERMLALPAFLRGEGADDAGKGMPEDDVTLTEAARQGLALTGFFLEKRVWRLDGADAPPARALLMGLLPPSAVPYPASDSEDRGS